MSSICENQGSVQNNMHPRPSMLEALDEEISRLVEAHGDLMGQLQRVIPVDPPPQPEAATHAACDPIGQAIEAACDRLQSQRRLVLKMRDDVDQWACRMTGGEPKVPPTQLGAA